jgi:hypothetical protein
VNCNLGGVKIAIYFQLLHDDSGRMFYHFLPLTSHHSEDSKMLRGTPNPSVLIGMIVFLVVCITTWTLGIAKGGFWQAIDDVSITASRGSRGASAEPLGQKTLLEAAPRVTLTEMSTSLGDIQNATLGV